MRENGLRARPGRRGLPKDTGGRAAVSDNVIDLRARGARLRTRSGLPTSPTSAAAERWLCVATVINLLLRVVEWAMKAEMTAQLVIDALIMAIWRRGKPDSLLHHLLIFLNEAWPREDSQSSYPFICEGKLGAPDGFPSGIFRQVDLQRQKAR